MTDPSRPRPVPGPPRPGPWGGPAPVPAATASPEAVPVAVPVAVLVEAPAADEGAPFADLALRPVVEHVAVFEAEHARLQRELGTIDQL
ncbi:hypothetical protein SAMN05660642_04743 [Geodermatophilus siccatus]|uniref:Uncharacterized protein n=1 Tax=Geodermatophilus siccatus TaxID=1137991 RepID=A0A1H0B1W0_9ACTN|nr:hypothetical protein [Geodermatophilus siccatus]SDN39654.1 hypothetical protein SAMN05660642_04743 [Geodermatophilus siccatus]